MEKVNQAAGKPLIELSAYDATQMLRLQDTAVEIKPPVRQPFKLRHRRIRGNDRL
jgi:hypothetical protein